MGECKRKILFTLNIRLPPHHQNNWAEKIFWIILWWVIFFSIHLSMPHLYPRSVEHFSFVCVGLCINISFSRVQKDTWNSTWKILCYHLRSKCWKLFYKQRLDVGSLQPIVQRIHQCSFYFCIGDDNTTIFPLLLFFIFFFWPVLGSVIIAFSIFCAIAGSAIGRTK